MSQTRLHDPELLEDLSAFMDGELDADRSRFLIQRLAHDEVLRARWERWQLQSGAMRKMAQPLPAAFAARVGQAIAAQEQAAAVPPSVWQRRRTRLLGGVAAAAALAVAAVFTFDIAHAPRHALPQVATLATHVGAPAAGAPLVANPSPTTAVAATTPVNRSVPAEPDAAIHLPIPVRAGVVTTFHLPLHPRLQRDPAHANPGFQPFPQPYAIDPELEAYLQDRQAGKPRDVFSKNAAEHDRNDAVHTVSWPEDPQ